jgi:hypothetical protein
MNQQDTIALLERCEALRAEAQQLAQAGGKAETEARAIGHAAAKAAWNEWALARLAELKALKKSGEWSAQRDAFGDLDARNEETRGWLEAAKADFSSVRFVKRVPSNEMRLDLGEVVSRPPAWSASGSTGIVGEELDFSGFIFPGTADFSQAYFSLRARFTEARFSGEARFRDAQFLRQVWFDQAQFSGEAQFHDAKFLRTTWFRGVHFFMSVDFEKTEFSREAWFDEAQFSDRARFGAAQFNGEARFHKVEFSGSAIFTQTQFSGITWFDQAQFFAEAQFGDAHFVGKSWFREARFAGEALFRGAEFFASDFQKAQFLTDARFHEARFVGETDFRTTKFDGDVWFTNAKFPGSANFERASFARNVSFAGAELAKGAVFNQVRFDGETFFSNARFGDCVSFRLAYFPSFVTFEGAHFTSPASFNAIRGGRAFDLNGARFDAVPDFIQAHFDEAPRLDNLVVRERIALRPQKFGASAFWRDRSSYILRAPLGLLHRVLFADRDIPARWRALKRLAVQARDHDREQLFFASEIRAARFAWDHPLPLPPWRREAWFGFTRFWIGLAYGAFSNYGRSALLPLAWWCLGLIAAAAIYLGEHEAVRTRRAALEGYGLPPAAALLSGAYSAWRDGEPCVAASPGRPGVHALSAAAAAGSDAGAEAVELSLRTGLLAIDPGPDAARRIYGCLYGVEPLGETAAPIVPSRVSYAQVGQKLFAALMLVLFALALRNMLRMK